MQLDPDGAQLYPAALSATDLQAIEAALPAADSAGTRLDPPRHGEGDHAQHGGGAGTVLSEAVSPATAIATDILGPTARPVRAVLFNKTPDRNWALGWHQDRTIAVRGRRDVPGFTGWTLKSGIHHAVPPFDYLERMLTLRLHLDDVDDANAPLLMAPGSHRLGRLAEADIAPAVARLGTRACLAARGDLWLYAAPLLHASKASSSGRNRRVLQLYYSADDLPGGLEWLGV